MRCKLNFSLLDTRRGRSCNVDGDQYPPIVRFAVIKDIKKLVCRMLIGFTLDACKNEERSIESETTLKWH